MICFNNNPKVRVQYDQWQGGPKSKKDTRNNILLDKTIDLEEFYVMLVI